MEQLFIVLFSASAIWTVSRREKWRRWGYILGLCSQPFYFYATWKAGQWGMLMLCFWYTYSWLQGVWNFWLRETRAR